MENKLSPPLKISRALSDSHSLRELDPTEFTTMNQLVSDSFGYARPHAFFDDFPVWNSEKNILRLGIFQKENHSEKLLAHAGLRFVEMQTSHGLVSAAMIGAVATHPAHRGKGYSTTLLKELIAQAEQSPLRPKWIFLWGSEHAFYEKLGFHLHGEQFRGLVRKWLAAQKSLKLPSLPIQSGLTDQIFSYLSAQKTGVRLTESDRTWFALHKTVNWFWIAKPFAFIGFERGLDLPEMIHEWGGDASSLQALFTHALSLKSETSVLGRRDDLKQLGFTFDQMIEENLCLARPIPLEKKSHSDQEWDSEFWISGLSAC